MKAAEGGRRMTDAIDNDEPAPVSRFRRLVARLVAWLPSNGLRVAGYRALGCTLAGDVRIGLGTVIACSRFRAEQGVIVGRNNRFTGPFAITIGAGAFIGRGNVFDCGEIAAFTEKRHMRYARRMTIGARALIHERHFFDLYGAITIGAGTWIAGIESQFWTHGASAMEHDIAIGANCYLGSAIRMAPGTCVGDRCVVGLGSVIVTPLPQPDRVLAGFPAKVLRTIADDDDRRFVFTMDEIMVPVADAAPAAMAGA